ncbi:MAG: penicillin-binding protein 2 [Bacteroides sp.]|nr:penicillin-binding protein 2 [Roseburia sp.]MCM1346381.1 penicillin-binding protein 2 [Bacteroides sp.]MCM1420116.1 penicillin-binding protein 2 [Bacteroides sp.]
MKNHILESRKFVIGGIALIIVVTYIIRLAFLQLMSEDYKTYADSNAFLNKVLYPSRGGIYDRNGSLLVYNQPAYDIMVVMREISGLDTLDLCHTLGMTKEEFDNRMSVIKDKRKNPGYSTYTQQLFVGQIPAEEFSVFQEKLFRFRGFYVRERAIRRYRYPYAAHVLGDVAEVSPSDIEADEYYQSGDYIGKQGVERSYEPFLRGEKGVEVLLRDARGRIQGHYKDGARDRKPVPGKDVTLSIDLELQKLGERLMEGKKGSIVAIEPKTGEVLCMVSAPTYDPRLMEGKQRGKMMARMGRDPLKPMINRAVLGTYPPGSTFKTSQALTFLQEGIITASTAYPCSHGFRFGRLKVGCHGHAAPLPLQPAIATSCNGYFCWGLYYMFGNRKKYASVQDAMTRWKDYMVSMGFGYKLGIDLPSEARGMIPNAQYYDKAYRGSWSGLTVVSISIGQGEVLLTPLQIANLGATIANRGYYITPHVVRHVEGAQLADSLLEKHTTMVDSKYYEYIVGGMRKAVTGGTCRAADNPMYEVCGKTGTAQNPHGKDHSAFMGFAPMNDPQIAIAVYVENGGWGANYGVPLGALMMEQYINGKLSPESERKAEEFQHKHVSYGLPNEAKKILVSKSHEEKTAAADDASVSE